ncbi:hypothetical protein NDU88_005601 [Pleurodeles waltl]|uniref:Uncharacterized protein n=1 Tax=Pleurodeles waltl TaxID=8319 RepID=A0AAV7L4H4_PLEWA|nr:hypothetical protein NDU88_005601 [Pleurodeles waltl]
MQQVHSATFCRRLLPTSAAPPVLALVQTPAAAPDHLRCTACPCTGANSCSSPRSPPLHRLSLHWCKLLQLLQITSAAPPVLALVQTPAATPDHLRCTACPCTGANSCSCLQTTSAAPPVLALVQTPAAAPDHLRCNTHPCPGANFCSCLQTTSASPPVLALVQTPAAAPDHLR